MSQRPISRSTDLQSFATKGTDLEFRSGCLLVKDVPYVNSLEQVKRGVLVMKLVLADDETARTGRSRRLLFRRAPLLRGRDRNREDQARERRTVAR